MNKASRLIVVFLLVAAAGAVLALKAGRRRAEQEPVASDAPASVPATNAAAVPQENQSSRILPRLVDLGAGTCTSCKMMAPILDALKKDFAETFDVEFIDVWKNPEAGEKYDIRVIPTQIFYDREGEELFRHEGFFGRKEILGKWKEFGVVKPEL